MLEAPQAGERFEGVENIKAWRKAYPANVTLELTRLRGRDDVWVAEVRTRYDETIYYGEGWEAPDSRAPWRAAPPRAGDPAGAGPRDVLSGQPRTSWPRWSTPRGYHREASHVENPHRR